jgi:hypothetical protein
MSHICHLREPRAQRDIYSRLCYFNIARVNLLYSYVITSDVERDGIAERRNENSGSNTATIERIHGQSLLLKVVEMVRQSKPCVARVGLSCAIPFRGETLGA